MNTIEFKNKNYPILQSSGFASRFAIPFAKEFCVGVGVDVGCGKNEWSFPGSLIVDPILNDYDALHFPYENLDYIFSSHCLEHIQLWVDVLDYWKTKIKKGGVIFLYLPHYNQEYWRPWHNRKHVNIFTPEIMRDYFTDRNYKNIFTSERDLNDSFMIVAEKQ
jgi:SAM-dependent methyltransferase